MIPFLYWCHHFALNLFAKNHHRHHLGKYLQRLLLFHTFLTWHLFLLYIGLFCRCFDVVWMLFVSCQTHLTLPGHHLFASIPHHQPEVVEKTLHIHHSNTFIACYVYPAAWSLDKLLLTLVILQLLEQSVMLFDPLGSVLRIPVHLKSVCFNIPIMINMDLCHPVVLS